MPFRIDGEWIPETSPGKPLKPTKIVKEKRKGAFVTLIQNLSGDENHLKKVCSQLKQRLACGGSVKQGIIELQGDQTDLCKVYLKEIEKVIR